MEYKEIGIYHIESFTEELILNGFDAKIVGTSQIECSAIFGTLKYGLTEKTMMAEFYRFLYHYVSKLSKFGLEQKIIEQFKKKQDYGQI